MRVYYGWFVAAICCAILFLIIGSTVSVFGLYVLPVAEEFGLSRADVNTAFVITNLGGAIQAPIMGRLVDIYPIRRIMFIGALCFVGAMITLSLSGNIWLNAAMLAVPLPWAIGGMGTACCMTLMARWFEVQRGRAMALVIMGMSLGAVIMSPVVGWLIAIVGWRHCLLLFGLVVGLLFIVLIALLRERPGPDDVEPQPKSAARAAPVPATPVQTSVLTTRQILQMPLFWLIAIGMALPMGVTQAISISLVPMAQEIGIGVTASAALLSVMGLAGIVSKFALVWIGDRFDKALALFVIFLLYAAVLAVVSLADSYLALTACAGLLGLTAGLTMPLLLALLADYVGALSFGSANGMATFMIALSGAATMRFSGEIYDRTGGYAAMFLALAGLVVVASVLLLACWRLTRGAGAPAMA